MTARWGIMGDRFAGWWVGGWGQVNDCRGRQGMLAPYLGQGEEALCAADGATPREGGEHERIISQRLRDEREAAGGR